jgi:hypothetical protein
LSKVVEQTATNRLELSVSAGTDAQNALSDDAVSSKYCYGTEFSCGTAHGQGPDLRSIARDMPVLVRERDAISLARQECANGVDTELVPLGLPQRTGHRLNMSLQAFGYQRLPDAEFCRTTRKISFLSFGLSTWLGC